MQSDKKPFEMNIELDETQAQGVYSNLVVISHSPSEFIVDFASMLPGMPKPKVRSRIILSAEHAKRLLLSLQENVVKYESEHGRIELKHRSRPEESQEDDFAPEGGVGFHIGEA